MRYTFKVSSMEDFLKKAAIVEKKLGIKYDADLHSDYEASSLSVEMYPYAIFWGQHRPNLEGNWTCLWTGNCSINRSNTMLGDSFFFTAKYIKYNLPKDTK